MMVIRFLVYLYLAAKAVAILPIWGAALFIVALAMLIFRE